MEEKIKKPIESGDRKESKKEGHIKVEELGIAIILHTSSPAIKGCYTQGLATCLGIVLEGEKGFSLIHDTLRISKKSIQDTARALGKVKQIHIYYSPGFYRKPEEKMRLTTRRDAIVSYVNEAQSRMPVGRDKIFLREAPKTFITITRRLISGTNQFSISCDVNNQPLYLLCPMGIEDTMDRRLRYEVNQLNSGLCDEEIEGDVHFDGQYYRPISPFAKTWDEIYAELSESKIFQAELLRLAAFNPKQQEMLTYLPITIALLQNITDEYPKLELRVKKRLADMSVEIPCHVSCDMLAQEMPSDLFYEQSRATLHLTKITPDIYAAGYEWIYNPLSKKMSVDKVDEKDIDLLRTIREHLKAQAEKAKIANIKIERNTRTKQLSLTFSVLEPLAIENIPILSHAPQAPGLVDKKNDPSAPAPVALQNPKKDAKKEMSIPQTDFWRTDDRAALVKFKLAEYGGDPDGMEEREDFVQNAPS